MKTVSVAISAVLLAGVTTAALHAHDRDVERYVTKLESHQEVPAVSSAARGRFSAVLDESAGTLTYSLTFEGLEEAVQQAHIHFGQRSVNGGIMIWLCSNLASPPTPPNTQACPQSGTITGTVGAANVVGPNAQGIAPTEFAEVVRALRGGVAYANVHSVKFPGGEIRGQLRRQRGGDHDD